MGECLFRKAFRLYSNCRWLPSSLETTLCQLDGFHPITHVMVSCSLGPPLLTTALSQKAYLTLPGPAGSLNMTPGYALLGLLLSFLDFSTVSLDIRNNKLPTAGAFLATFHSGQH